MAQEFLNFDQVLITKKAYEEGREAFANNLPITANSRILTVLRRAWEQGWMQAKEEKECAPESELSNDQAS